MAGARRPAIWLGMGVLLGAALAAPSGIRAAAADDVVLLPGHTAGARAVDLDGDGIRELVRLVADAPQTPISLEVWSHRGSTWEASRRLAVTRVDGQGARRPLTAGTPAMFIGWDDGERERLLLVVGDALVPSGGVGPFEVALVHLRDGEPELTVLPADEGPAERIVATDVDGDGIDELVVIEPMSNEDRSVRVLRRAGDGWITAKLALGDARGLSEPVIGESDSLPGSDIVMASVENAELHRLALDGGAVERVDLAVDGAEAAHVWPIAAAEGSIVAYVESASDSRVIRVDWPAGEEPAITESPASSDAARFVIPVPAGEGVVLIEQDPRQLGFPGGVSGEIVLRNARLEGLATVSTEAISEGLQRALMDTSVFDGVYPFGFIGPIPGGIDGSPAIVVSGHLVVVRDAGLELRPIGRLMGVAPLGLVGPDDAWMALSREVTLGWAEGYLFPSFPVADGIVLAPTDTVLAPESHGGRLEPELIGAAWVRGPDPWLASPDGGFEVGVEGPVGSLVSAVVGPLVEARAEIGPDGRAILRLDPRTRASGTAEYTARLLLLTPTGHLYTREWVGRVLREPPALAAAAETRAGQWEASVVGTTDAHAMVTIGGAEVTVGSDGGFAGAVDAGLLPREIVIRSVDPAGNETVRTLEVVGLVDYRGWPWIVVVGIATVLFGAVMYLRAPLSMPRAREPGEGTIEEVERG